MKQLCKGSASSNYRQNLCHVESEGGILFREIRSVNRSHAAKDFGRKWEKGNNFRDKLISCQATRRQALSLDQSAARLYA